MCLTLLNRQLLELIAVRNRNRQESCLCELPDILVGGAACGLTATRQIRSFIAAILRVRAGAALSVHRIKRPTVRADADRIGIPTGRNQSEELALAPVRVVTRSTLSAKFDHRYVVCAAVGNIQSLAVGRHRDAVRRRAFETEAICKHAGRGHGVDFFKNLVRLRADDRDRILAVFGHEQMTLVRTKSRANGLAA